MFNPLHIIFYAFACIALISATYVIAARNPVRSVLALVMTFFAMAGEWMLLRAEFLSLILILVYVGAVMTLFLFVVMMLNIHTEYKQSGFVRYLPFGIILVVVVTALMLSALGPTYFGIAVMPPPLPEPADYNNVQLLGRVLYRDFALPFETAGVILLAAIIAAITLTHRGPHHRKGQSIDQQLAAQPKNRVRLVDIPSEPRTDEGSHPL